MSLSHEGNWHALVCNLPVSGEGFSLGPGLWIKPVTPPLTIFSLAAFGSAGFKEWAVLEPIANSCKSEIISAKDADITPGFNALNRAWLATALLTLRGYTEQIGVACSSVSWDEAEGLRAKISASVPKNEAESTPFRFQGGLLDYHMRIIGIKSEIRQLDAIDAEWVADHFEKFNLLASTSEPFRFALQAAVDWRFSTDFRAAIARVWAGIEAILELKMETVFRMSTIAAALLAPRGEARIEKYKTLLKLYGARSKAVHGGQMKDELQVDTLFQSFKLLSEILLICIEKNRALNKADFESALFT